MLQRNTSGYPVDIRLEPEVRVWPGEDFDHPDLLAGFTPVSELDPPDKTSGKPDKSGDDEVPDSKPTPKKEA